MSDQGEGVREYDEDGLEDEFEEGDEAADENRRCETVWREQLRKYIKGFLLQQASSIAARPVEWLWPERVPLGHFTLLAGDPGVGKSLVALDLAARVSSGAPWPDEPDEPREPANVLILTTHESPHTTLRPRLEQAGADLERIVFANGMPRSQEHGWATQRQIRLPDDILSLARALIELEPVKLVILDPAWAYINRGRGRSRLAGPAQLSDVADMVAHLRVALLCVTDLSRARRGTAAYQAAGNRALTAAARAGWGVLRHPRERDRRVLLPLKMNLGPPPIGLEFQIHDRGIAWEAAPAKVTAEAVFAAERGGSDQEGAEQWLRSFLAHGSRPSREILAQAVECGISARTLRRAKAALGVQSRRIEFEKEKAHWVWSLGDLPADEGVGVAAADSERAMARLYATA